MIIGCICCGVGEAVLGILFLLGLAGCPLANKWMNTIRVNRARRKLLDSVKDCQCKDCKKD